MKYGEAESRHV